MKNKNFKNNILIFGSGSIGNHMAYAARKLGLNVDVTDISNKALNRMKSQIFVKRYGNWDSKINLVSYKDIFNNKKKYNLIILGTPPNTHYEIYRKVSQNLNFKNILIEKPLTNYISKNYKNFNDNKSRVFCGYNHSLSLAFSYFSNILKINKNNINQVCVEWKEGWSGILNAHPWLNNEFDSYLGDIKKGGGALQEHSHGLHLLLLLLKQLKIKLNKKKIQFFSIKKQKNNTNYDCYTNFASIEENIFIKYETDVVSKYPVKKITIDIGDKKYVIEFNYQINTDAVLIYKNKKIEKKRLFKKDRSTEFQREIKHILKINKKDYNKSPINFRNGVKVIDIIREILN